MVTPHCRSPGARRRPLRERRVAECGGVAGRNGEKREEQRDTTSVTSKHACAARIWRGRGRCSWKREGRGKEPVCYDIRTSAEQQRCDSTDRWNDRPRTPRSSLASRKSFPRPNPGVEVRSGLAGSDQEQRGGVLADCPLAGPIGDSSALGLVEQSVCLLNHQLTLS